MEDAMRIRRHLDVFSGFTLIELLIVIAIIAVLAALLFPVFAMARSKARQATGTSNAKQVSYAILMYIQDYDEKFPRAGWDCLVGGSFPSMYPGSENACGATTWPNVTAPYHKNAGIYTSPGDASDNNATGTPPDGRVSLLINDLLSHQIGSTPDGYASVFGDENLGGQIRFADGLPQAAVNAPADCVLLAEGHSGWDKVNQVSGPNSAAANGPDFTGSSDIHNRWHREQTIFGEHTWLLAGSSYNDWGQRASGVPFYNGGGIVAFTDGHVKYVKMVDSNSSPILCNTLKWTQHMDPQQRNADRDGCNDPDNTPGAGPANWN
jgi:prepilin-type N-terminal cleavage/methylation domain-containing protein/prepilin-type processing-associated H-X9-DG protein